jgi:hypothetical protein
MATRAKSRRRSISVNWRPVQRTQQTPFGNRPQLTGHKFSHFQYLIADGKSFFHEEK